MAVEVACFSTKLNPPWPGIKYYNIYYAKCKLLLVKIPIFVLISITDPARFFSGILIRRIRHFDYFSL